MAFIDLILTSLFSIFSGATATFLFFKARRKKEYAEANNQDIVNFQLMQDVYKTTIEDLKKEISELRAKYWDLEKRMQKMCNECPYKSFYEKNR